ncbi:hypothetical protein MSAN_00126000 [Mycena sanguinolenta]|uniref:Uncharacterized protein n=1 Tax=Mycena sanguinolenta TaxID=230812 RepID=A0A8H6ZKC4_9AGAR|nr:hypothetical protein MSAN_00126000 [Mycena sanguinolenta]
MAERSYKIHVHAAIFLILTLSFLSIWASRHPNIVQIWGAASSNGIHATLFNDDFIPLQEILDRHRDSHFMTVYIYACCNRDFSEVNNYLNSQFRVQRYSEDCMNWIRHSTGRLCTELTRSSGQGWLNSLELVPHHIPRICITASHMEPFEMVDSLTLEQYHHICDWNLRQPQYFDLSASTTVHTGAVFHCSSDSVQHSVEIAFLPYAEAPFLGNWTIPGRGTGEAMPDGWTRFQSRDVINSILYLPCAILPDRNRWLSQANHVFHHLQIISNFEDYVFVEHICFDLKFSQIMRNPPEGFLFLCPKEDFQTGQSSFCWPVCAAYWSLDPSGVDCLSPEDATRLGFPSFELTIVAQGDYWDSSVYDGLRRFHEAKGFDPYSQDVARHLGYPFFRLSSKCDALPWAYVGSDGEDFNADIDSDWNSGYTEDYEVESSNILETVPDRAGSEDPETSNCEDHDASRLTFQEDMVVQPLAVVLKHLDEHPAHVDSIPWIILGV